MSPWPSGGTRRARWTRRGGEQTTVGGRPAIRVETQPDPNAVDPPGTKYYSYWIDMGDGTWLLATTSDGPSWVGDYRRNKRTLDAMMRSLRFQVQRLPDSAKDDAVTRPSGSLDGIGLLALPFVVAAMWPRRTTARG